GGPLPPPPPPLRGQGHRLHRPPGRRGGRPRPGALPGPGPGRARRRRGPPAPADQGRGAPAAPHGRPPARPGPGPGRGPPGQDRRPRGGALTSPPDRLPIRRALVSVFDKSGLDGLAGALAAAGGEVVSTGTTAAPLAAHRPAVARVEERPSFPELLDGRVKPLPPRVHAGLLADRSVPGHRAALEAAGIAPFDLVVVNLYPFEETVADPGVEAPVATERIDVGGRAPVRG